MIRFSAFVAVILLSVYSSFAGLASPAKILAEPVSEVSRTEVRTDVSYTATSSLDSGDEGSADAWSYGFRALHRVPLSGGWYLALGMAAERTDFGRHAAPLPSHLQSASAVIALQYFRAGRLGAFLEMRPGQYFQDDFSGDAFDIPTVAAFAWPITDRFFGIIGFSAGLMREYPVLPAIGFRWNATDRITVDALLPSPSVRYKLGDAWEIWVGGEWAGGTYRTASSKAFPPELRGALLSYQEARAGAGIAWTPCEGCTIEASAGYAFWREFDYHRAGREFEMEGAPYGKLSMRWEF